MKKVVLLLSVFGFSLNVIGASVPTEIPEKVLQNQIVRLLDQPDITIYKETKVKLKFMITENGTMDVVSTTSEDAKLATYVKNRLKGKRLAIYTDKTSDVYSVTLKFIM